MIVANGVLSANGGSQQDERVNAVRNLCHQIVYNLYAIDYKLLDTSVGKLDSINRKTPLRKTIIEHESQQKQGKSILDVGKQASADQPAMQTNLGAQTADKMRDTQMSFASSTNR